MKNVKKQKKNSNLDSSRSKTKETEGQQVTRTRSQELNEMTYNNQKLQNRKETSRISEEKKKIN